MGFSEEIQKRIDLLRQECIDDSDKQLILTEKSEPGAAELQLDLQYRCILFKNLDKHKLGYFKNEKCADYIVFENREKSWTLHIFELKRTVTGRKWENEIKDQFRGAMQNALAIAGFMGISIELSQIRLYTAYRNDKINDVANPAKIRTGLHEKGSERMSAKERDWNGEKVKIDFLEAEYLQHIRIPLDIADGKGQMKLSVDGI